MRVPDRDRRDDAPQTPGVRGRGRRRPTERPRRQSLDGRREPTAPFGRGALFGVGLALVVTMAAQVVTTGVASAVVTLDAATLHALGLASALDGVAAVGDTVSSVGAYAAAVGGLYVVARTCFRLYGRVA